MARILGWNTDSNYGLMPEIQDIITRYAKRHSTFTHDDIADLLYVKEGPALRCLETLARVGILCQTDSGFKLASA